MSSAFFNALHHPGCIIRGCQLEHSEGLTTCLLHTEWMELQIVERPRPFPSKTTGKTIPTATLNQKGQLAKIPIELWREIFILATYVTVGYDTSYI